MALCQDCASCCGGADVPEYPDIKQYRGGIAVQFHDRAPWLIVQEDGTVTQRWTPPVSIPVTSLLAVPPAVEPVGVAQ